MMRIDLRDEDGRAITRLDADSDRPPTVVRAGKPDGAMTEHYLDWDQAFDDEGHLRKCPACQCRDLYVRRLFPPLTGFIVVMVVGLATFALYGLIDVNPRPLIVALVIVLIANIIFTWLSPRYLACYRCGSAYHDVGIPRDRSEWDLNTAVRYRPELRPRRRAKTPAETL